MLPTSVRRPVFRTPFPLPFVIVIRGNGQRDLDHSCVTLTLQPMVVVVFFFLCPPLETL